MAYLVIIGSSAKTAINKGYFATYNVYNRVLTLYEKTNHKIIIKLDEARRYKEADKRFENYKINSHIVNISLFNLRKIKLGPALERLADNLGVTQTRSS